MSFAVVLSCQDRTGYRMNPGGLNSHGQDLVGAGCGASLLPRWQETGVEIVGDFLGATLGSIWQSAVLEFLDSPS